MIVDDQLTSGWRLRGAQAPCSATPSHSSNAAQLQGTARHRGLDRARAYRQILHQGTITGRQLMRPGGWPRPLTRAAVGVRPVR